MLALAVTVLSYLAFLALSIKLTIVDAREHRLPNKLVALSAAIGVATIAITASLTPDPHLLLRGLTCAAGAFAVYLALHLLSRTKNGAGLGAGDVKLSAVLGLYLGWVSVDAAVLGIASGFVLGALFSLALIAIRRGNRRTQVAFGPWMLTGTWLVIAIAAANNASGLPDLLNSHYS
jgi:leader peptidase (prepilin peptidase)/N-methyltransferase